MLLFSIDAECNLVCAKLAEGKLHGKVSVCVMLSNL